MPDTEPGTTAPHRTSATSVGGAAVSRQDAEEALQRNLGARLRQARRARGLTLQDVEERSGGRWKAVVIGSYERGDRAVSAARLSELASFLEVEVDELLGDLDRDRPAGPLGALRFDLAALEAAATEDEWLGPLVRLVKRVRWQRGDQRRTEIAVRHEDLSALGLVLGLDTDELAERLAARGVLAR
jgi:transcriptional regulator with XRE-family HTH domain